MAEEILDRTGRAFMVDTTENPDIYQFFDMSERHIRIMYRDLFVHRDFVEIRRSDNGSYVWPSKFGSNFHQSLDLVGV